MKVNIADFANLTLLRIPASFKTKLEGAVPVPTDDVPSNVVTMLSRVILADTKTGERREVVLVYPGDADGALGRVSVLDPIGMALFGASLGDVIECPGNESVRTLRVEDIPYQPEQWMRMNLVVRD